MPRSDFLLVFQWWGTLFLVGAAAYPLTRRLFHSWYDGGYLFAKAVGMAVITFLVYLGAIAHLVPFTQGAVWGAMGITFAIGLFLNKGERGDKGDKGKKALLMLGEELFFFAALLFWTWVKAHEPSIHNLEKYMDFGFTKSILDSAYFPAPDMWYAGFPINYYYFGHTVMAVFTRLSGIDLTYTFNLMLSTIFALCFTMSFSIGKQICHIGRMRPIGQILGGLLTAWLVTMAGNMQTIYAFTRGYTGDAVKPFWTLAWKIGEIGGIRGIWDGTLWGKLSEGMNTYWYANATRFIPYTIHEFPSYSFVVSDVHGHVLSIPFVLLAIALLIQIFVIHETGDVIRKNISHLSAGEAGITYYISLIFYGFLCGVLLMTNALDGPIYFGLFLIIFFITNWSNLTNCKRIGVVVGVAALTSLPFLLHFKSFVNGLAVNCPPAFLSNTKIGPILFESAEKCQHSPLWMWWLLWGFFVYCGGWLVFRFLSSSGLTRGSALSKADSRLRGNDKRHELLLVVFFLFSILLLIFPEFFYFKDIYPMHFRSNTMFKLGYQAFIMLSIVSGYTIATSFWGGVQATTPESGKDPGRSANWRIARMTKTIFLVLLIPQLFLVSIFPLFSVRSYFNSLKNYEGVFGMGWFERQYPDDWAGISWLNQQVIRDTGNVIRKNSTSDISHLTYNVSLPVIVEADGDSYTDYDRFSAFTGLPTIIGWPVHEWLWRGSYDVVSPRREEVRQIYESTDVPLTKQILTKYHVTYVIVGTLERQKFKQLQEEKFRELGKQVFVHGETSIYQIL